jgi:glycerol-3-phosphate cytidylyltransferase
MRGEKYVMKKYKVGYTTGVFDLFHIGHLNILKRSKEQCAHLIVGVSTDEVVQGYKKKTPVIPFEERIAIVEAIKYVDEVVPQTSMDKFTAWENLKFDAIFHGDDWKGSKMYEEIEKKLNDVGVEIVYFPYTKGTSSTKLGDVLTQVLEERRKKAK